MGLGAEGDEEAGLTLREGGGGIRCVPTVEVGAGLLEEEERDLSLNIPSASLGALPHPNRRKDGDDQNFPRRLGNWGRGAISVRASRSTNSPVLTYLPSSSFFLFQPHCAACGTVIPQAGIEPVPPAVEARSPNHWTAGEFPAIFFF